MFLRRILLSGIATIALCGAAVAAGTAASPATGSSASPYPSSTGAAQSPSTPSAAGTTGSTGSASDTTGAATASGTAIAAIPNPQSALKAASVQSADGTKVGKVSKVHVDSSGQAQSIDVKVGAKTVSLPAAQATFDESNKTVVAQLSASDLKNLPSPGKASSSGSSPAMGGSSMGTSPSTGNSSVPDVAPGSAPSPSGGAPSNQ